MGKKINIFHPKHIVQYANEDTLDLLYLFLIQNTNKRIFLFKKKLKSLLTSYIHVQNHSNKNIMHMDGFKK
jgi:hypothetical protein